MAFNIKCKLGVIHKTWEYFPSVAVSTLWVKTEVFPLTLNFTLAGTIGNGGQEWEKHIRNGDGNHNQYMGVLHWTSNDRQPEAPTPKSLQPSTRIHFSSFFILLPPNVKFYLPISLSTDSWINTVDPWTTLLAVENFHITYSWSLYMQFLHIYGFLHRRRIQPATVVWLYSMYVWKK